MRQLAFNGWPHPWARARQQSNQSLASDLSRAADLLRHSCPVFAILIRQLVPAAGTDAFHSGHVAQQGKRPEIERGIHIGRKAGLTDRVAQLSELFPVTTLSGGD